MRFWSEAPEYTSNVWRPETRVVQSDCASGGTTVEIIVNGEALRNRWPALPGRGGTLLIKLKDGSQLRLLRCDAGRSMLGRRYSNSMGDGLCLIGGGSSDTSVAGASRILGFAIVAEARGNVGTHAQRVKILNLVAAELSMNGVLPIAQQSADNSVEHEALGSQSI